MESVKLRSLPLRDQMLVTSDSGAWVVLDKPDYELLSSGKISEDSALYKRLEKELVILTPKNRGKIVAQYEEKYAHIKQGPSLHIVVPTQRCNHKCSYCHSKSVPLTEQGYDLDRPTARRIVDFIFECPSDPLTIEFQGGDALLNFRIVQYIIERVKHKQQEQPKQVKFALVTNLAAMNEQYLAYLMEHNVEICTTLDGPAYIHDKNRAMLGQGSGHAITTKWIRRIKEEYNYPVNALMVITKRSLPYAKEIIDEYLKYDLPWLKLRYLDNLGYAQDEPDIMYTAEEFLSFWKEGMEYLLEINKKGRLLPDRFVYYILKKFHLENAWYTDLASPCGAATGQIAYTEKGDIYTCDEGRLAGEIFKLGNVEEEDYQSVITSDKVMSIVAASTNDTLMCDTCVWKPYCGVCPVCNYAESGNLVTINPLNARCQMLKGMYAYIMDKLNNSPEDAAVFRSWLSDHRK